MKNAFATKSRFISHKSIQVIKNKEIFGPQGLQIAAFQQSFFPILVETPYFGGVIKFGI